MPLRLSSIACTLMLALTAACIRTPLPMLEHESNRARFSVDSVEITHRLLENAPSPRVIRERLGPIIASSPQAERLVALDRIDLPHSAWFKAHGSYRDNAFLATLHNAHANHYPLVLSPDDIWLLIAQGFALHLRLNDATGEPPRTLQVPISGMPADPRAVRDWPGLIEAMSARVATETDQQLATTLVPRFSTTGPAQTVAYQLSLMQSYEKRFRYEWYGICGIPWIELRGTPEDWRSLRQRAQALRGHGIDWWVASLNPLLVEFESAAQGWVDRDFWTRIYKSQEFYANSKTSGWIVRFFPYIKDPKDKRGREYIQNPLAELNAEHKMAEQPTSGPPLPRDTTGGISLEYFPGGIASVESRFRDARSDRVLAAKLFAGFLGAEQDAATRALRPVIGWAVAPAGSQGPTKVPGPRSTPPDCPEDRISGPGQHGPQLACAD